MLKNSNRLLLLLAKFQPKGDGNTKKTYTNNIKNNSEYDFIRGRKLTDKEYREMLFREQVQTEEKLDKIMKELGV